MFSKQTLNEAFGLKLSILNGPFDIGYGYTDIVPESHDTFIKLRLPVLNKEFRGIF